MGRISFLSHLWKQQTLNATLITMLLSNEQHLGHGQFILLPTAFSPLHTILKQMLSNDCPQHRPQQQCSKVKVMYQVLTIQYFKKKYKYIHTESVHWPVFFFVFISLRQG